MKLLVDKRRYAFSFSKPITRTDAIYDFVNISPEDNVD